MSMLRILLGCLLVPVALHTASAQNTDEDEFTTGPPAWIPSEIERRKQQSLGGSGGPASDPDHDDIRVNQDQSSMQNETSIAVNPNDPDNWVGVANDYRSGTVECGWYTTFDGGQTWASGTFRSSGFGFAGDPCVCFTPNGHAHIVYMNYSGPGGNEVASVRSTDGGATWKRVKEVDLNSQNDKPQIDSDLSNSSTSGHITTAWNRFGGQSHTYVSTSTDNGKSWSSSQRVNDSSSTQTISPDVAYSNDKLYVMWADRGTFDIWVDVSSDGGVTWTSDRHVSDFNQVPSPIPGSRFRMFDIFAMAADWTDGPYSGNVYVAWHTWKNGDSHANVRCAVSSDEGLTWTKRTVHDTGGQFDQVFPGCDTDPQGNVHVTFYDRRLDPGNDDLWTWVARSSNGGLGWTDYQVSDVGWDHRQTEFPDFIGDYIDVVSEGKEVIPFWCDGRADGTQDVYASIVHLDLFTDVDTLSAGTGGQANFTINIGPNHAGQSYFLLGSFTGTDPGVTFNNGIHLPINWDLFTTITIAFSNSAIFQGFSGVLDGTGSATATLDTLGPFDSGAAGLDLDFAVLVQDSGDATYGSNPTRISLTN